MFLHFTNDVVQKRPKVNKSRCYNSFDVNDLNKPKETNSCTENFRGRAKLEHGWVQ